MPPQLLTALLTGAFTLGGAIGGILLTSHLSRGTDQLRITAEDERRWLSERRHAYASYLAIVVVMLADIGKTSLLLPDEFHPLTEERKRKLEDGVENLYHRWDSELQPLLNEVQLLASVKVAELCYRTSQALRELNEWIDQDEGADSVDLRMRDTNHLIEATRNAMRRELGIPQPLGGPGFWPAYMRSPWLKDEEIREYGLLGEDSGTAQAKT